MKSRDEIIKGITHHKLRNKSMQVMNHDECFDCPYRPDGKETCESIEPIFDDVLNLLKEYTKENCDGADYPWKDETLLKEQNETIECYACGHRLQKDWVWCPWCRWETAKRSDFVGKNEPNG